MSEGKSEGELAFEKIGATAGELVAVRKLCLRADPYGGFADSDSDFVSAMREITTWHGNRNLFYGERLKRAGFAPEKIKTIADCAEIPFVMASFFKAHETLSVPREKIALTLTSSGTTGQKSQVLFDAWSIGAPQGMVDRIFERNGWVTPDRPANYLLYTYETEADSKLGTSFTDHYLCKYAPVQSVFTALRRNGVGGHEFDLFGCLEKLREFEAAGLPVRIFGFPAFLHFTVKKMVDLGMAPLHLHPDSLVFLGGGWKGHAGKAIAKTELYSQVTAQLGIPDERLRDGFGSVEHCIPYVECANHEFHVPIYSRVFARDVKTLKVLPEGERGFLHFVSPYITSMPAHSVLMGDLASVHPAKDCGCDVDTPFFRVHGRAGTSKNKSCAVAAAELLGRERGPR
jgi:phenylacetate-coenzyme A ligase PaaK-like adenylate-forming protein